MLDKRKRTKVKNSYFSQCRPGRENVGPDTLTGSISTSLANSSSKLYEIHDQLCHTVVTHLLHFVRTNNIPYSTDVKELCHCTELKPQFYCTQQNTLIMATQLMEQMSIDFKGILRSSSQNRYMFTIVDEYSIRIPLSKHHICYRHHEVPR